MAAPESIGLKNSQLTSKFHVISTLSLGSNFLITSLKNPMRKLMSDDTNRTITREKHLDHMVRVVPFIVLCYAVQCFAILKLGPSEITIISIMVLGGFLALMIAGFITYDLRHNVTFFKDELHTRFFVFNHIIRYEDILNIEINEPKQSFATLTIKTKNGKHTYYFVDEADKIKEWLESQKTSEVKLAA